MKRFLLGMFLCFGAAMQAHASVINPDVNYYSVKTEDGADIGFFPLTHGYMPSEIAAGHSADGIAFEFNLDQSFSVDSILVPVAVERASETQTGSINLDLTLYSGSTNQSFG